MRRSCPLALVFASLALLGCTEDPEVVKRQVPPGAFALVHERPLALELLAAAQPSDVEATARLLVRDELMSHEQARSAPDRARVIRRAELARRLVEVIEKEVARDSPPSQAEIEREYEQRWQQYDRPRAVRTYEVFFSAKPPESDDAQFDRATSVVEAGRAADNVAQFRKATTTIIEDNESVRAVELPPVTADGRIVSRRPEDERWEEVPLFLVRAASNLQHPGDVSEVVGSEHGYHVLVATEIIPEHRTPLDEARPDIRRSIVAQRVSEQLARLAKDSDVTVQRRREDISTLLTLVQRGS